MVQIFSLNKTTHTPEKLAIDMITRTRFIYVQGVCYDVVSFIVTCPVLFILSVELGWCKSYYRSILYRGGSSCNRASSIYTSLSDILC